MPRGFQQHTPALGKRETVLNQPCFVHRDWLTPTYRCLPVFYMLGSDPIHFLARPAAVTYRILHEPVDEVKHVKAV
ncbi:hypothetical protein P3T43_000660 [Paraburkholderia sp. GAS41]|jgi:hypothetical protein